MDRLAIVLFILTSCAVHNSIVAQQYFVQGTRPVYIISESGEEPSEVGDGRYDTEAVETDPSEFFSRSGLTSSEEENAKDEEYETPANSNGSSKLPPNFSEDVNRNRRFPPRRSPHLKADPGSIDRKEYDGDEVPDPNSRGLSRFLWPFSLSVSKGKGGHPVAHHGHGPPSHLGGPFHNRRHGHGHGHHHHHHHGGHGYGHNHGHLHGHGGHHAPHGWGHGLDYEKVKLKYDIYKLKAKKKIAILQNKIELKKILSLLLQQKIKALEWISR